MNNKPTDKVSIQDIASRYPSDKAKKAIENALKASVKDQEAMSAKAQAFRSAPTLLDSQLDTILDKALEDIVDANFNGYNYALINLAKQAIKDLIATTVNEVIGDDEQLESLKDWYAKTKSHGGTHDEYYRLKSIVNNYNNLRADQRLKLRELINGR